MSYAKDVQTKKNPCTEKVRGKKMVAGLGGGYGFQVSDVDRLKRFLILGHEGGTYYADQRKLSVETVDCIDRLLDADYKTAINTIVEVSRAGRAPKNDPAIFALAYIASKGGYKAYPALEALQDVCRTGTHLFDFLNNCKTLGRGWGSAFKRAVAEWYNRNPESLAMQVTKYAQRNGWSHRDVLRKCHFKTDNFDLNMVLRYVTQRDKWAATKRLDTPTNQFLSAVEQAKVETRVDVLCQLIRSFGLVREHIPTEHLNNPEVWEALLEKMPLTAMIRNLGKMSSIGLVTPLSRASRLVCDALGDREALRKQRVHPVTLLLALKTYGAGRGVLGSLSWRPDQNVVAALDGAFYNAFDNVEPTGKNLLLGVDVSGSMSCPCLGSPLLSSREAAAVMAMVAARAERQTYIHGFSTSFVELPVTRSSSLPDVLRITRGLPFASTRCAVPMEFALKNKLDVDAFCIYTDNETNCGPHPFQALNEYRQKMGKPAKLAVFGFANSHFTVADPDDPGMMDFVGFDAAAPTLLADFIRD